MATQANTLLQLAAFCRGLCSGMGSRTAGRLRERWPVIRRQLPRDLVIVLWLALLAQSVGIAFVMTDSVHTTLALVLKGAPVRPGELAVFGYTGGTIPQYYSDNAYTAFMRRLGLGGTPATLEGPRRGDGFTKYLIGVPGDRVEVVGDRVFLQTRRGRLDMGRCKPATRKGHPLQPIAPQEIPEGYAYVWAPHVDALDSRYAVMGLVPRTAIVGRALRLW